MPPKAFVSWSSGKDSAFALWEAQKQGLVEVVGVLTTLTQTYDRVAMHGVRHDLLDRQIATLGLPALKVLLPTPCPNSIYETKMAEACAALKAQDISHIVFGDLFLQDIRAYREKQLEKAGLRPVFPIWGRPTDLLAQRMIEAGFEAYVTCIDPRHLDSSFAGRRFDGKLLSDLPTSVDPCGENGEFHTVVTGAPMFKTAISVSVGETVSREGFVFADIIPESDHAEQVKDRRTDFWGNCTFALANRPQQIK